MMMDRKRSFRFAVFALMGVALMVFGGSALGAIGPGPIGGTFELDGNVVHNTATTPPEDWADLYPGNTGAFARSSGLIEDVVNGTFKASTGTTNACPGILPAGSTLSTCDNVATSGSTKDDLNFGSWRWIWQQANDKNDIEHVWAVLYDDVDDPATPNVVESDPWIVFAIDKLANNGDAAIGVWFTQNDITLQNPDIDNNPNGRFVGVHKDNDVLIQADLTAGGDASRVEVFKWEAGGGSGSTPDIVSLGQVNNVDCSTSPYTQGFCGILEQSARPSGWHADRVAVPLQVRRRRGSVERRTSPPPSSRAPSTSRSSSRTRSPASRRASPRHGSRTPRPRSWSTSASSTSTSARPTSPSRRTA